MKTILFPLLFLAIAAHAACAAAPLSDSLLIEGYYRQNNKAIPRRKIENFLKQKDVSHELAAKSKGLRIASVSIGVSLWCANLAVMSYQINMFVKAIENSEPLSTSIDNITIPLTIGSEIATFTQDRLRNHSDFLMHKAVLAYNNEVVRKYALDIIFDNHIKKVKSNWYMQNRVLMPMRVLYKVLDENEYSSPYARASIITRETANQSVAFGAMFLILAAMGYIEGGDIDTRQRDLRLGWGIGLTSFGIANGIIAAVMRNAGIRKYNEQFPEVKQSRKEPEEEIGIIEENN